MSIEEMKNVDVRTVKREELTDIREVEVNKRKSREGQVKDYLRQIKNPYCYRYGEYVVKIGFEDTTVTLTDRLQELILNTFHTYLIWLLCTCVCQRKMKICGRQRARRKATALPIKRH